LTGEKVLVIDDDESVRAAIRDILEFGEYDVQTASDGASGAKMAASRRFDAVLLDLKLPDKNGIDVLSGILAARPDLKVIMMTGYATVETAKQAMHIGAFDYLCKPISDEILLGIVEEAVKAHRPAPRKDAAGERPDVMVVDGDSKSREAGRDRLEERGYDAVACASGAEALKKLAERPFSVLLVEQALPDMSGIELLNRLHGIGITDIIPIMCSSRQDTDIVVEAMKKGFSDYLVKPVGPEVLVAAIESGWSRQRAEIVLSRSFRPGNGYLVKEKKAQRSIFLLKRMAGRGHRTLCISREAPVAVREKHGLASTGFIWLTNASGGDCIAPTDIDLLNKRIHDFSSSNDHAVILLEGLEYLIVHNEFSRIIRFVHYLKDDAVQYMSRLILPIDPSVLSGKELAILERDLVTLDVPAGDDARETDAIDDVFLIYRNGNLICHHARRLKPIDQDILAAMLVGVQDFIKDSFRDGGGELEEMTVGDRRILIGRGKWVVLAAVISGNAALRLGPQIARAISEIENDHADMLTNWKGDMEEVEAMTGYLDGLINGRYAGAPVRGSGSSARGGTGE
jgi:DNA-binding response OmpR family regulator